MSPLEDVFSSGLSKHIPHIDILFVHTNAEIEGSISQETLEKLHNLLGLAFMVSNSDWGLIRSKQIDSLCLTSIANAKAL